MENKEKGLLGRVKELEVEDLRPHFGLLKLGFRFFVVLAYVLIGLTMLGALVSLGICGYEIITTRGPVNLANKEPSWGSTIWVIVQSLCWLAGGLFLLTVVRRWVRKKMAYALEDLK